MKPQDSAQILRRTMTVRRTDALFQAMSNDFLLRQQFITNPMGVLSEYISGTQIETERAAASNRLVYAVLADHNLLAWLHRYASEHRGAVPTGTQFVSDFAHAVAEHGGHHAILALLNSSVDGTGLVGFDEDLLHFFFNLSTLVALGGDEEVLNSPHGEEQQPPRVMADDSTCTAITWKTWLITRPEASIDNRFSARQPAEFAPRYVMVTLDELSILSAELQKSGALGPVAPGS